MKGGVRGALLGLLLLVTSAPAAELQWRLAREEGGVRVYLAEVPGSRYQAYRGVVTLRTDMPTLLALQEDVAASCAWIYACSEQRLLGSEGALSWIYSRYATPWPVTPDAPAGAARLCAGAQAGGHLALAAAGRGSGGGGLPGAYRAGRQRAVLAGQQLRRRCTAADAESAPGAGRGFWAEVGVIREVRG
jgi:hypothetical protein